MELRHRITRGFATISHITVIISKAAPSPTNTDVASEITATTYEYRIPVPHEATPQQVGEMVRKAYRRLESADE